MRPQRCAVAQTRFIGHTGRSATLGLRSAEPRRCGRSGAAI